ncbi:CBS domain-containing protein [Ruminococcus albus]|uniref:CBS domain containing protein n=1 Tax=Ruminococcus albus (strain ATCC 27210 / DSM 20455 / JCM 14654 / NCDO 2250 / 7) TaxID=697329 RepID=E6UHP9_RUMA7|nr:CBS domain-containing protein [Ruminococcus albus]ADU22098.1 CBS domain containing protein [Ruminococcus albus 7 = DSM 20455]
MNILKLLHPKACIEYLYSDCTARQTLEKMKHHGYSAVPVIDREGRFVKTVSEGDFLRFMVERGMYDIREMESYPLEKIPPKTRMRPVNVSSTVEELILLSMDQNFIPVIDDRGIFIGIVTRKDILGYCYKTIMKQNDDTETKE